MSIEHITEQQVVAWLHQQKARHNAQISVSTSVEAFPFCVTTENTAAVGETIAEALAKATKHGIAVAEQRLADAQKALEAAKARAA